MKKDPIFSKKALKWYHILRMVLFLAFFGVAGWVLVKTVFPNGGGYFDFRSYGSGKNTMADPRFPDGRMVVKGALKKGETMFLNASSLGTFSTAEVVFRGSAGDAKNIGTISIVQGYRAYLYPEGEPLTCPREGTLVVSDGRVGISTGASIRFFPSTKNASERGYGTETNRFLPLNAGSCLAGKGIGSDEGMIEGMLAVTDEGYFQGKEGEWIPFVSNRAFHSRYRDEDAVVITPEQFLRYPVSESRIGFLDGTVVSYGDSAYVVSGNELRPIDSPDTFLAKGYLWEDVVAMTGEEFGMYTRGKLYTKLEAHPNGTVFVEPGSGKMFLIENGKKREIVGTELQQQFSAIRPIVASSADLGTCALVSHWFSFGCTIDWAGKERAVGAEYQFAYDAQSSLQLRDAEVTFIREKNRASWNVFVRENVEKLKTRYPFL